MSKGLWGECCAYLLHSVRNRNRAKRCLGASQTRPGDAMHSVRLQSTRIMQHVVHRTWQSTHELSVHVDVDLMSDQGVWVLKRGCRECRRHPFMVTPTRGWMGRLIIEPHLNTFMSYTHRVSYQVLLHTCYLHIVKSPRN